MAPVDVTTEAKNGIPAGVKLTPMMKQYVDAKSKYPDALLFFRMGDFYEMFFEDAELGGQHLELTVTSRDKGSSVPAPMSGFPHHQLPSYLSRALAAGFKVAVCEQLEDAAQARGLVRRGITQVITPGLVIDSESLEARANNYLVSVVPHATEADVFGLAALDVSTGEFKVTELLGASALRCEISRIEPRELIVLEDSKALEAVLGPRSKGVAISRPGDQFFEDAVVQPLLDSFVGPRGDGCIDELRGFGFGDPDLVIRAAGAVLAYVKDTQQKIPHHTRLLVPYRVHETLILDETAKANLELFRTLMDGRKRGALLGVLDRAGTAMGGRRMRQWIAYPLMDPKAINERLDGVEWLKNNPENRAHIRISLQAMYDLERLNARIGSGAAGPRDLWFLRVSLERVPELLDQLGTVAALASVTGRIDPLFDVVKTIASALSDDPPGQLKEGGVIRSGHHAELDEWTQLATSGKDYLLDLEQRERDSTGIPNLKVRYNRVFGYYIEVSRSHTAKVPEHYVRKQTLTNAERYFTEELKEFEEKVVTADNRRLVLESELFQTLRSEIADAASAIAQTASALAELDALTALAEVAHQNDYCRPVVDDGDVIDLIDARHPVVEDAVGREDFVPNSIRLDRTEQALIILTGPNMAGKSTAMRQVALITLMAQMGSFVPAAQAHVGVVDRIFTRVGAADDLAAGRSTFMVEMHETATILREATSRSLLILDEIGRGTSTFDGVSIAWSVAEYIHDVIGAKTLFATHYHELTDMQASKPRVRNFTIAVKEWNDEVIFLRQLVEGGASRSYGIQVARLAGLPNSVIERSKIVLNGLEGSELDGQSAAGHSPKVGHSMQLSLFSPPPLNAAPSKVEKAIKAANLDEMTPLQALNFVNALRGQLD
ncbi:MAG: DNA mismatch repair protein MutS [Myxococcales bacterium]|nr:DNA mismatch repair protein MutS [Myxococcales bacterium]